MRRLFLSSEPYKIAGVALIALLGGTAALSTELPHGWYLIAVFGFSLLAVLNQLVLALVERRQKRIDRQGSDAKDAELKRLFGDLGNRVDNTAPMPPVWCRPTTDTASDPIGRDLELGKLEIDLLSLGPKVLVIWGQHGVGKSRLALNVADRLAGQNKHFTGGLLWTTLGEVPAVPDRLREWLEAPNLARNLEPRQSYRSDVLLVKHIGSSIGDRNVLVVIDDVWSVPEAQPFFDATIKCTRLVTTSVPAVKDELIAQGAQEFHLEGLMEKDALLLMRQVVGNQLFERLPDDFRRRVLARSGSSPFAVIQLGHYLRDQINARFAPDEKLPDHTGDLDRILLEPLPADIVDAQTGKPTPQSGISLYRHRLSMLANDSEAMARVRTIGLLRPFPETFAVEEVAELGAAFADGTEGKPPDGHGILKKLAQDGFLEVAEDQARFGVHYLAQQAILRETSDHDQKRFDAIAARYWGDRLHPANEETSYEAATNREAASWLRLARNWLYHLNRLENRGAARVGFDYVYFERYWWYDYYRHSQITDILIEDCKLTPMPFRDALDDKWMDGIKRFNKAYEPGHAADLADENEWAAEPNWNKNRWKTIERALMDVLAIDDLDRDLDPSKPDLVAAHLETHQRWHVRAVTDIFLAHCYRHGSTNREKVESLYRESRALFERCREEKLPCDWNFPWLDYEEAETALKWRDWDVALDFASSVVRGVLSDDLVAEGISKEHEALDFEVLALSYRTKGDVRFELGQIQSSLEDYDKAVCLAYAWQFLPKTDEYTTAFYGDMQTHLKEKLSEAREVDPDAAKECRQGLLEKRRRFGMAAAEPGQPPPADDQLLREVFPPRSEFGEHGVHHLPAAFKAYLNELLPTLWREARGSAMAKV